MADTKFAQFLATKKLDRRRIVVASRQIETLQPEDRAIKHAKRKPRSGRPVTNRAIDAALAGKAVSGPIKSRILRAVNRLLEQKKQEKVDLRAIF